MISTKLIAPSHISRSIIRSSLKLKPRSPSVLYFTRSYIRPHYYNEQPLSKSLQQQRNPFHQFGRRINQIDPKIVLWTVIGTNVSVYCMWQHAINSYKTFGDDHWLNIMAKNFINSTDAMKDGRYHTLLTSAFSHKSLDHLGINMLVLYSIGQGVLEAVGASRFLLLYAGAGVVSSLVALTYRQYIRPLLEKNKYGKMDDSRTGSMGASGW